MKKIILLVMAILIVTSCIPQKLGSTGTDKLLGIFLGAKPSDSSYTLSEEPTSIDEGTTKEIKIHLAKAPETDAVITITSDTPYLELNGSNSLTLTFTPGNYSSDQTFTIAALIDDNAEDETGNITISADYGYVSKTLKITHKEAQGDWISITPATIYRKNFPGNIMVKLNMKPVEDMQVTLSSTITSGLSLKGPLTFTRENYNQEQIGAVIDSQILYDVNLYHLEDTSKIILSLKTSTRAVDKTVYADLGRPELKQPPNVLYTRNDDDKIITDYTNGIVLHLCPYNADTGGPNCTKIQFISWMEGIQHCNKMTLNDRKWRIPTIEEINYIVGILYAQDAISEADADNEYWSSTTSVNDKYSVKIKNPAKGIENYLKENIAVLYCVSDTLPADIPPTDIPPTETYPMVSTVAGSAGNPGIDDGTGTAATFNFPFGITTDGTNLYVADTDNNIIRKMVLSTGEVTTIAGSAGNPGIDDGIGTAAKFVYPFGITTDGSNLYVTDAGSGNIRKIKLSNMEVSTIFTGLNDPRGITTDGTNLYVAIAGNHIILVIDKFGSNQSILGSINTPGIDDGIGTAATFNSPSGITTDGTNLYVADTSNHTIRKIVLSTGEVTTFAGSAGTPGIDDGTGTAATFNFPFGITTDGTNLYVADTDNHLIRVIDLSTEEVTTLAGSAGTPGSGDGINTDATFNSPSGIVINGGIIYIADRANHTIRKIQ
ncbi:MAG: hypothetical protein H7A25_11380 [Leptospiraceae bacterium]|nr:hypothetical protein [Leptospiraceae bacterium]